MEGVSGIVSKSVVRTIKNELFSINATFAECAQCMEMFMDEPHPIYLVKNSDQFNDLTVEVNEAVSKINENIYDQEQMLEIRHYFNDYKAAADIMLSEMITTAIVYESEEEMQTLADADIVALEYLFYNMQVAIAKIDLIGAHIDIVLDLYDRYATYSTSAYNSLF